MALYPGRQDWETARRHASLVSSGHDEIYSTTSRRSSGNW